jgi:broad specificity phosphatase PhoE
MDAKLVEAGTQQAREMARFWADAAINEKIPLPETLYTSPLMRCLETTRIAFSELIQRSGRVFQPTVKELLRERLTDHTCDKRSQRSLIESRYPSFIIEPGFSEEDNLWKADRSEPRDEHVARKQAVLEDIFSSDPNQFISLTTHSYALSAILQACGSEEFRISEGAVIALLIRAERVGEPHLGFSS